MKTLLLLSLLPEYAVVNYALTFNPSFPISLHDV